MIEVLAPSGTPPVIEPVAVAGPIAVEGRTVCLLDCRYERGAEVFDALERWFHTALPGVRVTRARLGGGVPDAEVLRSVAQAADAAVVGVGIMSNCVSTVIELAAALEADHGIPTVALHTGACRTFAESAAAWSRVPALRQVIIEGEVVDATIPEIEALVDRPSAGCGSLGAAVVAALGGAGDDRAAADAGAVGATVAAASEEELLRLFRANRWTDGLPIVLPTRERVERMLTGTARRADEAVGAFRPLQKTAAWTFTVEQVAVNAVMAGLEPRCFPVVLALAASGVSARSTSTTSMTAMALVSGPIAEQLGLATGTGAMGPHNPVAATIGRAYALLSQNLQGGSEPGISYLGSQGNNASYVPLVLAENTAQSPWPPFHVGHGYDATDNVVSVWYGVRGTHFGMGIRRQHWRQQLGRMLQGMDPRSAPLIVLDPLAAHALAQYGSFASQAELAAWACEVATIPAAEFWDHMGNLTFLRRAAEEGREPWATNLAAAPDDDVAMFAPHDVGVAVVGDGSMGTYRLISGGYVGSYDIDPWRVAPSEHLEEVT